MNVTPAPGFSALEGGNQRMIRRLEMLKCVGVLRIFAASDMATRQTDAKLGPLRSKREALLAAAPARRNLLDAAQMFARLGE
jgi:hypothetical protein